MRKFIELKEDFLSSFSTRGKRFSFLIEKIRENICRVEFSSSFFAFSIERRLFSSIFKKKSANRFFLRRETFEPRSSQDFDGRSGTWNKKSICKKQRNKSRKKTNVVTGFPQKQRDGTNLNRKKTFHSENEKTNRTQFSSLFDVEFFKFLFGKDFSSFFIVSFRKKNKSFLALFRTRISIVVRFSFRRVEFDRRKTFLSSCHDFAVRLFRDFDFSNGKFHRANFIFHVDLSTDEKQK